MGGRDRWARVAPDLWTGSWWPPWGAAMSARILPSTPSPARERGSVAVWALFSSFLVAGIILAGTDEIRAVDSAARFEFSAQGHAEEIAQAGLTDAYAWFRRQPVQPVVAFAPRDAEGRTALTTDVAALESGSPDTYGKEGVKKAKKKDGPTLIEGGLDATATNPTETHVVRTETTEATEVDTQDVSKGLVRAFEIAPGIVGRYTVFYGREEEPYTDADGNGQHDEGEPYVDLDGDGAFTPASATRDVSAKRGLAGQGTIWYLTSRGEVFRYQDPESALGVGANTRLGVSTWGTEIRRLNVVPPAAAAICARRGSNVTATSRVRVTGDTAIAYPRRTGRPGTGGAEVKGSLSAVPAYADRIEDVFGLSWPELQGMADLSTDDPERGVPGELRAYSLNVVIGDVVFDRARPLKGLALLAVRGDVTIRSGSNSFFNGVLYVEGDLTVEAPAMIRGTVIATGRITLRGSGGDYTEVEQDSALTGDLLVRIGQYRHSKAPFRVRDRRAAAPLGAVD